MKLVLVCTSVCVSTNCRQILNNISSAVNMGSVSEEWMCDAVACGCSRRTKGVCFGHLHTQTYRGQCQTPTVQTLWHRKLSKATSNSGPNMEEYFSSESVSMKVFGCYSVLSPHFAHLGEKLMFAGVSGGGAIMSCPVVSLCCCCR